MSEPELLVPAQELPEVLDYLGRRLYSVIPKERPEFEPLQEWPLKLLPEQLLLRKEGIRLLLDPHLCNREWQFYQWRSDGLHGEYYR